MYGILVVWDTEIEGNLIVMDVEREILLFVRDTYIEGNLVVENPDMEGNKNPEEKKQKNKFI